MVNKVTILRPLNVLLAMSLVVQILTSLIIFFHIRVPKAQFVFELHTYNGLLFILLAVTHFFLNWNWIKAQFFKKSV